MNTIGYLQRVSDGVMLRDATMADLWRAISATTPEDGQPLSCILCAFPLTESPIGTPAAEVAAGPLVRVVGASERLVRRVHRHMRTCGNFYDL